MTKIARANKKTCEVFVRAGKTLEYPVLTLTLARQRSPRQNAFSRETALVNGETGPVLPLSDQENIFLVNITDDVFPVAVIAEVTSIERYIFDVGFFTTTLSNWSTEKHSVASGISNHCKFKETLISVIVFNLDYYSFKIFPRF